MAYIIPSTAATPALHLDACIGAFVVQEFSIASARLVSATAKKRRLAIIVNATALFVKLGSMFTSSTVYLALPEEQSVPPEEHLI